MKIITGCAKVIKVFSTKIIIICAESLYSNTPEEMKCLWVSLIVFLLETYVWTFNSRNFNPSEMSKTFVKKCVSLCSIYYDR